MKRIKMIIAYDGSNYCGWQIQKNGITIEEIINRELSKLLKEDIVVIGASRTDSGVHALGNVAVFDTETKIPGEKISFALNQRLPNDIRVRESLEVPMDFHPRYCNSIKTYQYKIYNSKFPDPLERLYSRFIYFDLNIDKMKEAAKYIQGEHDFKSFCSSGAQVQNTVRTVTDISVNKEGNMIIIRVSGTGFLYNMVRIIVGTLVHVGLGRFEPSYIKEIIEAKNRQKAGPKSEACGLTLMGIDYLC